MVIQVKALPLDMAKRIADAAEAKAIMDNHGNLKYYRRMDGNNVVSVRMSQLKVMTSASIPISTKALGERNKGMDNGPYLSVPGIVLLEGGLPIITRDGQHIGSIGVSGANSELDGVCVQAGLDVVAEEL